MAKQNISKISAFFTGLVITSAILFFMLGNDFFSLIFLSIVCTLGISLVIWIPLFWLVGYITLSIIYKINPQLNQSSLSNDQDINQSPVPNNQSLKNQGVFFVNNKQIYALVDYIKKAQAKGYSDSQIETRLKKNGWSQSEIDQAFQLITLILSN